jgi:hypothetical protein
MDTSEIRDRFAAAALTGLLLREQNMHAQQLAERAYTLADYMLEERSGERQKKNEEEILEYKRFCAGRDLLEEAGWDWDGEELFSPPWNDEHGKAIDGMPLDAALREHEASQQVVHPHYCGPCQKCGHRCPNDDRCDKCGFDPMEPGDTLCVECDRDAIDKEKAT